MYSTEESNKALIREFLRRIFQAKDPQAAAELITERYIQHDPEMPTGRAGFLQKLPGLHTEFPQLHAEIKGMWAEGDTMIVLPSTASRRKIAARRWWTSSAFRPGWWMNTGASRGTSRKWRPMTTGCFSAARQSPAAIGNLQGDAAYKQQQPTET